MLQKTWIHHHHFSRFCSLKLLFPCYIQYTYTIRYTATGPLMSAEQDW